MAFTDPQTLTVDSTPHTLALVKSDGYRSEYLESTEDFMMTISHQESKGRTRRMVRVDNRVVAADPLTSVNEYKSLGVYLVIDEPEYGFDDDEIDDVVQGLLTWLTTANVLKVCGNEH
jgi:predicted Zn-dependent peptidase